VRPNAQKTQKYTTVCLLAPPSPQDQRRPDRSPTHLWGPQPWGQRAAPRLAASASVVGMNQASNSHPPNPRRWQNPMHLWISRTGTSIAPSARLLRAAPKLKTRGEFSFASAACTGRPAPDSGKTIQEPRPDFTPASKTSFAVGKLHRISVEPFRTQRTLA
jgi:hypothetical protein